MGVYPLSGLNRRFGVSDYIVVFDDFFAFREILDRDLVRVGDIVQQHNFLAVCGNGFTFF